MILHTVKMRLVRAFLFHGYAAAAALLGLLLIPFFALHGRGRIRLKERLGLDPVPPAEYLWFHGASMGEISALRPVLRLARERYPALKILVTATSPTGLDAASGEADILRLLPFDSPWFLKGMLSKCSIRCLVITETELWPGLIFELHRRGVRSVLINAIVTDYTFGRYRALSPIVKPMLDCFSLVLCGTEQSRERFIALGAAAQRCVRTGNSKYDRSPSVASRQEALALKQTYFADQGPTLVLGSLRPGEEEFWFPLLQSALEQGAAFSVVAAPRHREKFDYFAEKLAAYHLEYERRSSLSGPCRKKILLLDTYGELESVYSFCEVAFVGGSLVDWGGHNPLEAAVYGSCIVMGPFARNVRELVEEMLAADALWPVRTKSEVLEVIDALRQGSPALQRIGKAAQLLADRHRGASGAIMEQLSAVLA